MVAMSLCFFTTVYVGGFIGEAMEVIPLLLLLILFVLGIVWVIF